MAISHHHCTFIASYSQQNEQAAITDKWKRYLQAYLSLTNYAMQADCNFSVTTELLVNPTSICLCIFVRSKYIEKFEKL